MWLITVYHCFVNIRLYNSSSHLFNVYIFSLRAERVKNKSAAPKVRNHTIHVVKAGSTTETWAHYLNWYWPNVSYVLVDTNAGLHCKLHCYFWFCQWLSVARHVLLSCTQNEEAVYTLNSRHIPANTKHLYDIYTMFDQRRRRWSDVV